LRGVESFVDFVMLAINSDATPVAGPIVVYILLF
jgi:hypothetical protein